MFYGAYVKEKERFLLLGNKRTVIRIRLYDTFNGSRIHLKYDFHCLGDVLLRSNALELSWVTRLVWSHHLPYKFISSFHSTRTLITHDSVLCPFVCRALAARVRGDVTLFNQTWLAWKSPFNHVFPEMEAAVRMTAILYSLNKLND